MNKKSILGYWKHETRKEIINSIEETGFKKAYQIIDEKFNNIKKLFNQILINFLKSYIIKFLIIFDEIFFFITFNVSFEANLF